MQIVSCTGISTALMLTTAVSLAAGGSPPPDRKVIYGLSEAQHFSAQSPGQYYIQAGTFNSVKNANRYKQDLIKRYHQPVIVKRQGNYHVVLIGPIHSAAEVRALNNAQGKIVSVKQNSIQTLKPVNQNKPLSARKLVALPPVQGPTHFEVLGALGIANLRAGDAYLSITDSETDRLVQTNRNDWDDFTGQLGLGYIYYLRGAQQYSDNIQWFPWVEPEVNAYYIGRSNLKGDVWRFSSSAFNDFSYTMPVESTRLMFDTALTVLSMQQYSLYAIGGIGNAWNRVGYRDVAREGNPCPEEYLNLNSSTHSSFAWEAGGGLSYAFNNRFVLSLEYLYADLGRAKTPTNGFTGGITNPLPTPTDFRLTSQSALLGLHVAI